MRKFFGLLSAGKPSVCVALYAVAHLAAKQLIDGNTEVFALYVPQGHFHSGERAHQNHSASPICVAVCVMPKSLYVVRILANEVAFQFLYCLDNRRLAVFESRFPDAVKPTVCNNFYKHPICPIRMAYKCLNLRYFHFLANFIRFARLGDERFYIFFFERFYKRFGVCRVAGK